VTNIFGLQYQMKIAFIKKLGSNYIRGTVATVQLETWSSCLLSVGAAIKVFSTILHVVLYEYSTWPLILSEKNRPIV
jgi:hypothetical protein